jgi:hypothetical protein
MSGGLNCNPEKAIDQFRATCSQQKKPLPFVPSKPDYARLRTYVDMKELMIKRRKESKRREKLH